MHELLRWDATRMVREIRARTVSPIELLDAHIAQIERVNPRLNALVTPLFEEARAQARTATERAARTHADLPPLFGLPVTIKDSFAVNGARFTAGALVRRSHVATGDAEAVRRLRAAGAIVLGKTNCPDLCAAAETRSLLFGLTRNPWNVDRSAGGSSGGEAALIAAQGSPLGLGSDIAGSIRIPSAFCGIAGLKPTPGRVPAGGHEPVIPSSIDHWNVAGPMARTIRDLALAFGVLTGSAVRPPGEKVLSGKRVLVPRWLSLWKPSQEVVAAVERAARALLDAGMVIERDVNLPMESVVFNGAGVLAREWLPALLRDLGGETPLSAWGELVRTLFGRPRVSSSVLAGLIGLSITRPFLRLLGSPDPVALERARRALVQALGPGNVILWPVFPDPPPRHGFVWNPRGLPMYTGIFNALGFPSVAVPAGRTGDGLPLGVQVAASPGGDETALAAAMAIEQRLGKHHGEPC